MTEKNDFRQPKDTAAGNGLRKANDLFETGLPGPITVRRAHAHCELFEGTNTLLFCWTGKDRHKVLSELTTELHALDPAVSIDGSFVDRAEDYAFICLLLHRRGGNSLENQRKLKEVGEKLKAFAAQPMEGEKFPVKRVIRLAAEIEDEPGLLARIATPIAAMKGNLGKLDTERWAELHENATGDLQIGDLRCLLFFTIELPDDSPDFLLRLLRCLEDQIPGIKLGTNAEADKMFEEALVKAATFARFNAGQLAA